MRPNKHQCWVFEPRQQARPPEIDRYNDGFLCFMVHSNMCREWKRLFDDQTQWRGVPRHPARWRSRSVVLAHPPPARRPVLPLRSTGAAAGTYFVNLIFETSSIKARVRTYMVDLITIASPSPPCARAAPAHTMDRPTRARIEEVDRSAVVPGIGSIDGPSKVGHRPCTVLIRRTGCGAQVDRPNSLDRRPQTVARRRRDFSSCSFLWLRHTSVSRPRPTHSISMPL